MMDSDLNRHPRHDRTTDGAPMRLLHTSDWHLGRTLYGADLLAHQAAFLDWLLDQAITHRVHAVVVSGDVYDRAVPPTDAVAVLDRALRGFAAAGIPVLLTSGNHDSAVRLGFGSRLSELAGIHLRTAVADIARPVLLADEHGQVAMYGIPYLLPDAVMGELGADRSHASVLAAASARIRADAERLGIARTVVAAHAFISGASPSDSERDIRVGGIGDAPASVFAGLSYVALGHLHGQQDVSSGATETTVRYSGSPLAFSFSERHHAKSVTLAEIDGQGQVSTVTLAAPVPRPLREVRGKLDDLLAEPEAGTRSPAGGTSGRGRGRGDGRKTGDDLTDAWVRVVLTDAVRPPAPMERLREKWPHTLVLDFEPECQPGSVAADLGRLAKTVDPVEICELFVEFTSGGPAGDDQRAVLRDVVEAVQHAEFADVLPAGAEHDHVVRTDAASPDEAGSVDEWLASAGREDDWLLDAELAIPRRGGNPAAA
jgi:exonuclease SbcD